MQIAAHELDFSGIQDSIIASIADLLRTGRISSGQQVEAFEEAFSAHVNGRACVAVASGTAALELILQALDVAGRTVIVPANTNFATYIAARRAGANVRLVDVDRTTLSPSTEIVRGALDDTVAAVVLVHMGGLISPQIFEINALCEASGVALIEDAAHAHGSCLGQQPAGTFGTAAGFSFFATKVLPTGEGGMIVTGDGGLAARVSKLRNLGKAEPWVNVHTDLGGNSRMHEFAAVLGLAQLPRLNYYVERRGHVAQIYQEAFANYRRIRWISPWHPYSGYKAIGYLADDLDRTVVKHRMQAAGVQPAGEIYALPLHRQPVLAEEWAGHQFPGAEYSCDRQLCLPIYPSLTDPQVTRVVNVVTSAVQEQAS